MKIIISSGHGKYVRGAAGILDEVDEARKVVEAVADILEGLGVDTETFHDNTSQTQDENLAAIVDFHNSRARDLDISVHFNAFEPTTKPMGTEVLYVTQSDLANAICDSLAVVGFVNRGAKFRDDLYFLNNTEEPAVLIEVCFVDSEADAQIYKTNFDNICLMIAEGISEEGGIT